MNPQELVRQMNPQEFESIVLSVVSDDNALRKRAEDALRTHMADPALGLPPLLNMIRNCTQTLGRSLASIILRRLVSETSDFYESLSDDLKMQMKQFLLDCLANETEIDVRMKIRDTVGEVAAAAFSKKGGGWSELLQVLFQQVQHGTAAQKEDALYIFSSLSIDINATMRQYAEHLYHIFFECLGDTAHLTLQVEALRASISFMLTLDNKEIKHFGGLLPLMMQVLSASLNADEKLAAKAMINFVDLVEQAPLFLRPQLDAIVDAMSQIACADTMEDEIQLLALEFLTTLAEKAPSLARRKKDFIEKMMTIAMRYLILVDDTLSPEEWMNLVDVDKDSSLDEMQIGGETVDRLSTALGGEQLVNVGFTFIQAYLKNTDWKYRHGALFAIAHIGEGCYKVLDPEIGNVVDVVLQFVNDPHPRVKYAACHAMGQLAVDFAPGIQNTQFSKFFPAIMPLLADNAAPRVQAHACACVSNFCEECQSEHLSSYLDHLMRLMLQCLQVGNRHVQEQAITAVACIADCAAEAFGPYYDTFMSILKEILRNAGLKEHRLLRGKSMEAISLIGMAVGKERFFADATIVMDMLIAQQSSPMEPDDPQINYLQAACARIAKVMGEQFVPYLPIVLPSLFQLAKQNPKRIRLDIDEDETEYENDGFEFAVIGGKKIGVRTSMIEDKANAVHLLSCYISHLKDGFAEFIEEVATVLGPSVHWLLDEDTRISAGVSLRDLVTSLKLAMDKRGVDLSRPETIPNPNPMQALFSYLVGEFLMAFKKEFSLTVLVSTLSMFREIIDSAEGAVLSEEHMGELMPALLRVLESSANRRGKRDEMAKEHEVDAEEAELIEDENAKEDSVVSCVGEVIASMMKKMKMAFMPHFAEFEPVCYAMLQRNQDVINRQTAICVYCDAIESVPQATAALAVKIAPFVMEGAQDPSKDVRLASAYTLGPIAVIPDEQIRAAIPQIVSVLMQIIAQPDARSEDNLDVSENSISSLLKITKVYPEYSPQVIPLFVQFLPYHADDIEAKILHDEMLTMIEAQNSLLFGENNSNVPKLIDALRVIRGSEYVFDSANPRIDRILAHFG